MAHVTYPARGHSVDESGRALGFRLAHGLLSVLSSADAPESGLHRVIESLADDAFLRLHLVGIRIRKRGPIAGGMASLTDTYDTWSGDLP
jgi:hypothetical protein